MKNPTKELIVIGGGAAGLLAAGIAASRGIDVLILEKNKFTGKKLAITGKGRCNITNASSVQEVLDNIPSNPRFMYSALNGFSPDDVMQFFTKLGVPLKTERGGRVFPLSDKASDVLNALRRFCSSGNATIVKANAKALISEDGVIRGVSTDSGDFLSSNVILCTGGASYPGTGSTGDGYKMAAKCGHKIVTPRASLVPLESQDSYCGKMQGFSLKNVRLTVYDGMHKRIYEDFGEMLFTHFGVSGPLVLSASAHMRDFENNDYTLEIDLKPALDEKKLDKRILKDFDKYSNRDFANALSDLAGQSMIPVLVELSGIPPHTKVNSITKMQRQKLIGLFKSFPVHISGPRPIAEAIVTAGGIDVRDINPKTMESRLIKGLYFAGEVIDVDAYTGGYNLQIAWSTAYAAAISIAEHCKGGIPI